jgi:hypothetical protein
MSGYQLPTYQTSYDMMVYSICQGILFYLLEGILSGLALGIFTIS